MGIPTGTKPMYAAFLIFLDTRQKKEKNAVRTREVSPAPPDKLIKIYAYKIQEQKWKLCNIKESIDFHRKIYQVFNSSDDFANQMSQIHQKK